MLLQEWLTLVIIDLGQRGRGKDGLFFQKSNGFQASKRGFGEERKMMAMEHYSVLQEIFRSRCTTVMDLGHPLPLAVPTTGQVHYQAKKYMYIRQWTALSRGRDCGYLRLRLRVTLLRARLLCL